MSTFITNTIISQIQCFQPLCERKLALSDLCTNWLCLFVTHNSSLAPLPNWWNCFPSPIMSASIFQNDEYITNESWKFITLLICKALLKYWTPSSLRRFLWSFKVVNVYFWYQRCTLKLTSWTIFSLYSALMPQINTVLHALQFHCISNAELWVPVFNIDLCLTRETLLTVFTFNALLRCCIPTEPILFFARSSMLSV